MAPFSTTSTPIQRDADHDARVRRPPAITVAIPVYNEEALLAPNTRRVVGFLEGLHVDFQLIIGSNGSTDATVAIGRRLAQEDARIEFFHLPAQGVGLAFREFVRRARHPFLISLDMDLSSDLHFMVEAVALTGQCDIVVGSKRLGPQRRSVVRRLASDTFLWFARHLTGLPYDDYSIGAKAYDVGFLREHAALVDEGSSYVLDLCHAATREGGRVVCVPVACEDRRASKFSLPREGVYKFSRLFQLAAAQGRYNRRAGAGDRGPSRRRLTAVGAIERQGAAS